MFDVRNDMASPGVVRHCAPRAFADSVGHVRVRAASLRLFVFTRCGVRTRSPFHLVGQESMRYTSLLHLHL